MSHQKPFVISLKLQTIATQLNELKQELQQAEQEQLSQLAQHKITSLAALGAQLNERRKALGLDIATLELQTGISASTLKRLFKDPEQVKFGSVYAVAAALGVSLCAVV